MYKHGDVCPICGEGSINVEKRKEVFEYKGHTLEIELTVYSCDVCGEEFYDNEEMRKNQRIIKDFQRKVDGLLTSSEIKAIREKYDLSQRELARILGVAEKSIAKYEAGFVSQSRAMDNLLRIIDRFPETLEYLINLHRERLGFGRILRVNFEHSGEYSLFEDYSYDYDMTEEDVYETTVA